MPFPAGIEVLIPANRVVRGPNKVQVATCADLASRTAASVWPSRTTVERPHGLPEARRQRVVLMSGNRRRTDNDYEPFALVVELDGRLGHEGQGVFRDRTRDNITTVSGRATLRFGWADVDTKACEVAQDVAVLLWSRGWRGKLKRCGVSCRVGKVPPSTA